MARRPSPLVSVYTYLYSGCVLYSFAAQRDRSATISKVVCIITITLDDILDRRTRDVKTSVTRFRLPIRSSTGSVNRRWVRPSPIAMENLEQRMVSDPSALVYESSDMPWLASSTIISTRARNRQRKVLYSTPVKAQ